MHPSGAIIICEGSKEQISEEILDQIMHRIQVEQLVRKDNYTQLADRTILGNEFSLHQNGCMVGIESYTCWSHIKILGNMISKEKTC